MQQRVTVSGLSVRVERKAPNAAGTLEDLPGDEDEDVALASTGEVGRTVPIKIEAAVKEAADIRPACTVYGDATGGSVTGNTLDPTQRTIGTVLRHEETPAADVVRARRTSVIASQATSTHGPSPFPRRQ